MTRVRLAAAEERARAAERAADELRRRTTPTTTSTTIIRGLSEVVATGASTGEGEGDGDGDGDTPMSDGTHARFFTPAASTDPTPSATPKGADPSKDYSSFAALIVETDGRKARGDAGEGEAAALADVKDASFGGRRLYDADQADDAIARLRAEMDDRAGLIEQLQNALSAMVDKMASLKSEKDEVESVADSLSEKNVQLQSHIDRVVLSRVVSLMRNASVARAFRTWREWVQAEKIERAEKATLDAAAEKTAALVRASTDEFRLATLKDEVEELRAQLAALTARAETAEAKAATAEAKAATAEKWAAEAESKAFDAVSKAKDAEKRTNTPPAAAAAADSEAVKAAEIRAAEAESRALESLAKAADAEAEAAEAKARRADAEERVGALERRMDAVREEANAVEVAAAKVVAEARTDAEDARALLDSARATAEASEASRAAEIRELEARLSNQKASEMELSNKIRELEASLARTAGESKAAETELSNQSALIERLGDEVRRWREAKAEADARATKAESEAEGLRSSIAAGDERVAKRLPSSPSSGQSPPAAAAAADRRGAPLAAHRLFDISRPPFFGGAPSKEPKDVDPASAAAVSVSVSSSSPELAPRLAAVTAELDALRARHESLRTESAAEADSLRERLVAAERSLERTMVKAEERVAENRKLKEAIETATAEAERARGEAERAKGEAAAAAAEVELMVAKVASAKTDAGKELDALKEKFEKHKKFSDEKVRALAKAQSDVRALEGKLEDATRDLAAANEAARAAERRREEEEDAAAKAPPGGKDAAAKDKNNAGVQKDVDYPATAAKESQTDVDASIASTERTRTDASPPDGSESVDRNVQKEYDDVQKADEKRDERLTEEVDALRLSASASRLRIASLEEQEKVFAEAIASKSSQIQSLERSLEESNARLEEASERALSRRSTARGTSPRIWRVNWSLREGKRLKRPLN